MNIKNQLLAGAMPINESISMVPRPAGAPQNMPKVMICLPSGRTWEARTATAVAGMATFSALQGFQIGIANMEGSMITKQRNDLMTMAMQAGFDYALQVDTDMVFPPDCLLRLYKHNKDIVGATYNKRVPPYETLGKLKGEKPADIGKGGLREAELMPGGMMLIRMDVFRKLGWPWYFETYQWPGENGVDMLKTFLRDCFATPIPEEMLATLDDMPLAEWLNKMHNEEFQIKWNYYSEDLNFCRKARRGGYRIWCDLDLTFQMTHLGVLEVTCKKPEDAAPAAVVDAAM